MQTNVTLLILDPMQHGLHENISQNTDLIDESKKLRNH